MCPACIGAAAMIAAGAASTGGAAVIFFHKLRAGKLYPGPAESSAGELRPTTSSTRESP